MSKRPDATPGKKRISIAQRRALELLAGISNGATEALPLVHGFSHRVLVGLVLAGLATVASETVRAGRRSISVERYRITDAGRKAIEG
jgi:hypothetical protein